VRERSREGELSPGIASDRGEEGGDLVEIEEASSRDLPFDVVFGTRDGRVEH